MIKNVSRLSLALSLSMVGALLLSEATQADTYVYKRSDGSTLLTDKRVTKKGHRLIQHYKSKKKPAASRRYSKKRRPTRLACGHLSAKAIEQKAQPYIGSITKYAKKYRVDVDFIKAIIRQESCFNPKARSHVGAMGLMQLMPGTARDLKVSNAWNSDQNIRGGVKYISQQLRRFKGNKKLALAAYNAGPGKVLKHKGIPPYKETRNYVRKIMAEYERLKARKATSSTSYRAPKHTSRPSKLDSDFQIFWGRTP
ncbi:MAG TPA: lytic transglycosylase domain-containing protein [Thiothrix sp.]|nr:lytic transglycosylase domain-containing protein [Thiothrix sp.]